MGSKRLNNKVPGRILLEYNLAEEAGIRSDKRSWLRKAIQVGSWTAYTWHKMSMTGVSGLFVMGGKSDEESRNSINILLLCHSCLEHIQNDRNSSKLCNVEA